MSVLVCRGCCCGTEEKHPNVDHRAQFQQLQAALPRDIRSKLWEVDCLGPYSSSNVVVVRSGQSRRWFGEMLNSEDTRLSAQWIRGGGKDVLPPHLAAHEFEPDARTDVVVDPADLSPADREKRQI
jgi:hypothetical protein